MFKTEAGIRVKKFYSKEDIIKIKEERPGFYPFTRGIYPDMYRKKLWTMRQYSGYANPKETNERFKFLISKGETGLSVAFDLPTQLGYDSDDPKASGAVGKVGVPITTLKDMRILFEGIDLSKISCSMTINATAPIILAFYFANAKNLGYELDNLRGTIQNDILKEYMARNTYIFPPEPSLKLCVDVIEYCVKKTKKFYPISISGYHIREAGANAIQELAFTFSNAIEYVNRAMERGLKVDDFAPRLSFFFCCRKDFFEEVAKFRAARRIWAKIMRERFKAKRSDSWKLKFHVQTSGETLTAQQPLNNIVRVTLQALIAVLGGAQSIHTNSYDEAISLPTEDSVKLSIRTQQILAYEFGLTNTVDPLGGSYYVEWLTEEIEERVFNEIEKIDRMGGSLKALEKGYFQRKILEEAYKRYKKIEKKESIIVGVNEFLEEEKITIPIMKVDPKLEEERVREIKEFKASRDNQKVKDSLKELNLAARKNENLIEYIERCGKNGCTLGEISQELRQVYGEYLSF
ncbi:Methylmalonyl-CoA mutase [archaeon HR06]|nr:Methylmalonyl-CoA mutase [archaeon HR06]